MCYKSRAVKGAAKQELASVRPELAEDSVGKSPPAEVETVAEVSRVDASCYCPVCSERLESRRCKLVCPVCGYYMSCADYY
jgi:Zn finger protein HypA/HybF involved in hydrogenase expression